MKPRVIFRADGNSQTGYGHFIRSLGIAGLINEDFECYYATQTPTDYQLQEIYKVCQEVILLQQTEKHHEEFLQYVEKGDTVVIDDYNYKPEWQLEIRAKGCRVVYIDDFNDKNYVCDALINNIPGFSETSFKKEPYTKLYLGIDYALLRKEFFNPSLRQVSKEGETVFISFGGSDIHNLTEKIITMLQRQRSGLKIHVLAGDAYTGSSGLSKLSNVTIYKNISAAEVASLIAAAAICIIPASSLLNEAACIGSKVLLGYFTANQQQPYQYFVDNQLAIGVGDYRDIDPAGFIAAFDTACQSDYLIKNQQSRYHYQQSQNLKNIFLDA